jgi:hypothetical protein
VDMTVTFILRLLNVPYFIIDIVVAFIMAFIFAFIRHDRRLGPFYKDMMFHRNFAMLFIVLLMISYVMGYLL